MAPQGAESQLLRPLGSASVSQEEVPVCGQDASPTREVGDTRGRPDISGGRMKKMSKAQKKVGKVMGEFKEGTLHSGKGGKVVTNPKQAVAIALSEAGMAKKGKKK